MSVSEPQPGSSDAAGVGTLVGESAGGVPASLTPRRAVRVNLPTDGDAGQSGDRASSKATATRVEVLLPVYNESGLIRATFSAVDAFARDHTDYAMVFVDDGSSDQTPAILRELIDERTKAGAPGVVRLLALTPNRGKGGAVRAGINQATAPLVMFTDGDLAYSLEHLPKLAAMLDNGNDVVIGSRSLVHRSERNTTAMRRLMGWTFNRCARLMLGLREKDTQAGLKGFTLPAARRIFRLAGLGGFAFDVELVYLAHRLKYRVGELPAYVSEEHSYKRSKVNLAKDPARMFGALVQVRAGALLGRYGRR